MITAVFAPAVGATVTSGNDAAQDAVDTPEDDTVQTDEQSPSSQTEDDVTADNATEDDVPSDNATEDGTTTDDDLQSNANGTVEVIVRVEEFDVPAASTMSNDAVVDELKAHAEESQQPIVDYAESTEGVEVLNDYWLANALLLELDTEKIDVGELVAQPGVTDVHENFEVEAPEPVERDNASTDAADTTYGLDQINATEVWEKYGTKGAGVSVAVLDTGVDPDHPDIDIKDENWAEIDNYGNEVDSEPHDSAEHGTHTSGTVSGGDASGEYIGVAPEVELMHGKVLDGGSGSFAAIIGGMQWAVEENADVTSMSLGAEGYAPDLIEPVQNAQEAGTIVVSSSGNSEEGSSGSPGNVYETFAIGASDESGDIATFSSGEEIDTDEAWGSAAPSDWPDSYVVPDVAAPGVGVRSSIPGGGYAQASGTSMAAPHVSGAIALMLSASADDADPELITSALEETAWKPAGAPDETDTRYGEGIIDVAAATDRVAADSGVEGTVTNQDGEPIADATVELDDIPRTTDENGEYVHRAAPGEYDVTVDAFGYEPMETTVTVEEGNFTEGNFQLSPDLAVELAEPQPRSVQAGSSFSTSFEVANLESLTVDVEGYDAADATLSVDGETADFGEPVTFDEPVSDTITVQVGTTAGTDGTVELTHSFSGTNDSVELSTGPTGLFDEPTEVGIVAPEGQTVTTIESHLRDSLDARFQFSRLTVAEAVEEADAGTYDSYVVQSLGGDEARIEAFADATTTPELGVVYLQQSGEPTDAIADLANATDDPRTVGDYFDVGTGPINYEIDAAHPIFDGVAEEGDTVELYTPEIIGLEGYFHSYFEDYRGHVHSEKLASTSYSGYFLDYETGTGMAVENNSRTVLAASLTPSQLVSSSAFSSDATAILENSVSFASETPPAYVEEPQDERVEPGDATTVNLTADGLEKVKVDVVGGTLDEDDVSLYVDGTINAFGEYRGLEEPTDVEDYGLAVTTDEETVGDVELEVTAVTVDDDGETETTTIRTGSTAVYEAPLDVGDDGDVETLETALDIVPEGGEIVLDDGEYANWVELDTFTAAGYVIDTPGVTIRAAEGASPTVRIDGDGGPPDRLFEVRANDVTLSDLRINVRDNGTAFDSLRAVQNVGYDGVTVENSTIGGDRVIFFSDAEEFTVRDTDLVDVGWSGIQTRIAGQSAGGGLSEDVLIDNVTIQEKPAVDLHGAVQITESNDVTVTNSDIEGQIKLDVSTDVTVSNNSIDAHGLDAINTFYAGDTRVEANAIENASTAVKLQGLESDATVTENVVRNSSTGVLVSDIVASAEITRNDVAAGTGIDFRGTSGTFGVATTDTNVTYNDLSGSDLAFLVNDTEDGAGIDARLNYVGHDEPIAAGNVTYEPYLTESPLDRDSLPAPEAVDSIGVDLEFEAGDVAAMGVPGPTTQTVDELFTDEFEGAVYGFDAASQSWTQLTADDELDALDALIVVAETDARAHLEFTSGDVPPGPGQTSLVEGWNFVAAPTYGSVDEAFDLATTEFSLAAHNYDRPQGQLASAGELDGTYATNGDGPRVSPFEGTFVFAEGDGTMPARLTSDPTTDNLYDGLGIADPFADGDTDAVSVDAVLSNADEMDRRVAEARLSQAVYRDLEGAVEESNASLAAVNETAIAIVEDAPADHRELVENATADAVQRLLDDEFGTRFVDGREVTEKQRAETNETESLAVTVPATASVEG